MIKKDFATKLAEGVRRAKQTSSTGSADAAVVPSAPNTQRFAQQSDQSPPVSLDQPWDNLHPARIWPD